jgi:C4-dicarboxylate-specific signal transduction histidine kinase
MGTQPVETQLRKTGLGVVGDVPWGTHFFLFYETKEDLLDALVPYFKAGLESGELCLWVVAEPLTAEEARNALRKVLPEFDKYLADRSIEILRDREFYSSGNSLNLPRVLQTWAEKSNLALSRGYAGLRASCSTAWLERKDWQEFCNYEKEVTHSIKNWQMTVLCTYPLAGSTAAEILDVARTHQFAIARRNRGWEVVETSELKQAKSEIQRLNSELERRVTERTQQLATVTEEMRKEMIERQYAEEALQEAQSELARVKRALDMEELVATIAHEVNQPLTAIVTNANFCLRLLAGVTPNHDEFEAAITEIVNDGTRASSIISRIRSLLLKGAADRCQLDINEVIRGVTRLVHKELTRNGVSLRSHLAPDLPHVHGDRVQLQQVVLNLILNSIDAIRTLTDRPREIRIKSATHPDGVLVQVHDSGPGINPEQVDRIFEPFFTTKPEGIGIGLSICRSIVESHGGHLWAVAASNGALFEFTLPSRIEGVS